MGLVEFVGHLSTLRQRLLKVETQHQLPAMMHLSHPDRSSRSCSTCQSTDAMKQALSWARNPYF